MNPFAPKSKAVPRPASAPSIEDFIGRIRAIGADDQAVAEVRTAWDESTPDEREEALGFFADITDEELRERLAERTSYDPPGDEAGEAGDPDAGDPYGGGDPEEDTEADDEVPDGADEVIAWIASDPARAGLALAAEAERPPSKRRTSVVDALTEALGEDAVGSALADDDG